MQILTAVCLILSLSGIYAGIAEDRSEFKAEKVETVQTDMSDSDAEVFDRVQEECEMPVEDCFDVLQQNPGARNGLHQISLRNRFGPEDSPFVFCDMDTDAGGWTVIQRRHDGSVNFLRDYQTYVDGFGNQALNGEFWIGTKLLNAITSRWNYELRINLKNSVGEMTHVHYHVFAVGTECDGFPLTLSHNTLSVAGDAMSDNVGMKFSTFDHDVDESNENCAALHQAGWWFANCTSANLNGQFLPPGTPAQQSMFWYTWQQMQSLAAVEMMIRPTEHPSFCEFRASDCKQILELAPGSPSGEYFIYLNEIPVRVWCDMESMGGGWTVFQRRIDGSVNFYRNYASFQQGFGDVSHEFWLGNENLHQISSVFEHELLVDLQDFDENYAQASYGVFGVGAEADGYRLSVGDFSGTAGDSLSPQNGMMFTTFDRDQDTHVALNCAQFREGAWWYSNCGESNLNGLYKQAGFVGANSVSWFHFGNEWRALKVTEMKMRRKN